MAEKDKHSIIHYTRADPKPELSFTTSIVVHPLNREIKSS